MKRSEKVDALFLAIHSAQSELKNPIKNRTANIQTKSGTFKIQYADLPSIIDLVTPILGKNGLFLTQTMNSDGEGRLVLLLSVAHVSGQFIESEWVLPKEESMMKMGAAITYARRYMISSILNLAADDDRGEDFFSFGEKPTKTESLNAALRAKVQTQEQKE